MFLYSFVSFNFQDKKYLQSIDKRKNNIINHSIKDVKNKNISIKTFTPVHVNFSFLGDG